MCVPTAPNISPLTPSGVHIAATIRPPGAQTRTSSRAAPSWSGANAWPNVDNTRSKRPSSTGRSAASASTQSTSTPASSARRRAGSKCSGATSNPVTRAPHSAAGIATVPPLPQPTSATSMPACTPARSRTDLARPAGGTSRPRPSCPPTTPLASAPGPPPPVRSSAETIRGARRAVRVRGMARDPDKLSTGRVRRTAAVGAAVGRGLQGRPRRAPGGGRADGQDAGPAQGRGGEDRPARVVHRHGLHPRRVPRRLSGGARQAARRRARDAFKDVRAVLDEEWDEPIEDAVRVLRRAGHRGRVDRPGPPRRARRTGATVAVKIQYPGMAKALAADMSNAG